MSFVEIGNKVIASSLANVNTFIQLQQMPNNKRLSNALLFPIMGIFFSFYKKY